MKQVVFFVALLFILESCSDRKFLPPPEFILEFNTPDSSYSEKTIVELGDKNGYKLMPIPSTSSSIPYLDSVLFVFSSALIDVNENVNARIEIPKVYPTSLIDTTDQNNFRLLFSEDFNSLFKLGKVNLSDGRLNLRLVKNGQSYSSNLNAIENELIVEKVDTEFDWLVLVNKNLLPMGSSRRLIVTFSFASSLVSFDKKDTISITNGKFKGIFVDR